MRIILAVAALAACGKTTAENKPVENHVPAPVKQTAPPQKAISAEELVKTFRTCWDEWNAARWVELRACFNANASLDAPGSGGAEVKGDAAIVDTLKPLHVAFPDAAGKPELVLASGNRLIAIVHLMGKHTGGWNPAGAEIHATQKQVSSYFAEVIEFDDKGKITQRSDYFDLATMIGQLKPVKGHEVRGAMDQPFMVEQTVIAADDARERTGLGVVKQLAARFGKDDATLRESLADDLKWSEQPLPKDLDRKGALARISQWWKAFPDAKLTVDGSLAAGDYVAAFETFEGTTGGKKVSVPILAIHKVDNGKVAAVWMFYQSSALTPPKKS